MRSIAAVFFVCLALSPLSTSGHESFPYKTTVVADDVYVRSGPGQNYYATEKLKKGQDIEVYRHDPGGWCAIRPVDGSFTWVSGRYLKPISDDLAVVTEEGVSARVGSRFSDVREVVQVRLHMGEKVEVIEAPLHNGAQGDSGWFKIAPPSGEFRWVSAKYLSTDYPRDGLRRTTPPGMNPPPPPPGERQAGRGDPDAAGEMVRDRYVKNRALSPEEYQAELERIDLELSVMVVEDPRVWSFDQLIERTNYLLDQSQTAVERGRARVLANKIARFDDIKQRQDAVLAMRDRTDRSSRLLTKLRPKESAVDVSSTDGDIDGRFDGVGQLTQVVSPKTGAPRYALVDRTGDVRCYVTPAPGVNLRDYMGRQVGVNGTRGYMPEQRTGHIMARHVTPLEGSLVR